ncbi:hypothetical protein C8Q77DRAFT_1109898 [Trametes polyzona]|nr:hypothetical protein C8Q77DRAFT_1109898 [Trametes polyzona]
MYLPNLRSVRFHDGAPHGVPWESLRRLLHSPQITSMSFDKSALFTSVAPFPADPSLTASTLEELSYPTLLETIATEWYSGYLFTVSDRREVETACLSALVLGMRETARSLTLPMDTCPLRDMARLDWPRLHTIRLGGSFPRGADRFITHTLPSFFRRTPHMEHIEITAALPIDTTVLCSVLGRARALDPVALDELRSLTVAHPDPEDAIFSTPLPNLVHLSIRDYPRRYDVLAEVYYQQRWRSPILSATEMLAILRRIRPYGLTSLEVVYLVDDSDPDLLDFITDCLPQLRHLQVHRYRRSPDEVVQYRDIARKLSSITGLTTLRLNLDLEGDPGPYSDHISDVVLNQWRARLTDMGWEVLDILEPCTRLESVALLSNEYGPPSTWLPFRRFRRATRGMDIFDIVSPEHIDSLWRPYPLMGRHWYA